MNPRPVTPDMTLRYFDVSHPEIATHIKFVVTNNQCTGQPSYQGDQDNDPNINSDCRATQGPTAVGIRRGTPRCTSTEVQVFGANPTMDGTKVTTG